MSISIGSNNNFDSITGLNFVDTYPAGVRNASTGAIVSNNCFIPLAIIADADSDFLGVSQGVIPGLGSCEAIINVVGTTDGNWHNNTSDVFSDNAPTGQPADAFLSVTNEPLLAAPRVSESFTPDTIPGNFGVLPKLKITLSNLNVNEPILGAQINSHYAAGLHNNSQGGLTLISDTCNFLSYDIPPGANWAKMAGGTVPAGGECSVVIQVESGVTVTNPTGDVPSGNAQTGTSASATLTVLFDPDLTLTKSHVGNFTQGQTDATYTLTANNLGWPTSGTVTVTDALPPSLTATAMSGTGWTCSVATTTCSRSDVLSPPTSSYPPITLKVDVSANAPANVTNTASVSGGGDINPNNNDASDPTTITPSGGGAPDLTLTKLHAGNFSQGQTGAVYSLIANNVGGGATNGTVTVTDTLPPSLTATAFSGPGWNCTPATLTCTRSDALAAGMGYPAITLTVNVAGNAPAGVTNTAAVSGGGQSNTANDTASDPTTIDGASAGPDLSLTKNHAGNFSQGQTGAVYSLIVHNVGGATTSGLVTVGDTLPQSMTATDMSGPGWTCDTVTTTCTRSDPIAATASYPAITLTVNVAANAPAIVMNTAIATGGNEQNAANDTAIDPTTIDAASAGPDLSLTKNHAGNFSRGQPGAVYSLIVHNVGNATTNGTVNVADVLPPSMTATAMNGPGWNCSLVPLLSCSRSDALVADASYPAITLTVNVAANAPAMVTNSAAVSGGGETNSNNDAANDPTTITPNGGPVFDLTLTKSHAGNFTQGQIGATYSLIAHNIGSVSVNGFFVNVVDTLPIGLSATAMSGPGWSCTMATTTCTRNDSLAANASYPPITLTVNVAPDAPASVTNLAGVSAAGEFNTGNNAASDPTTITPNGAGASDMTLTKSHTGNFTQGQIGAVYSLTANNIGGTATNGPVTVTDTLPGSLTATALSGPGWNCTPAALSCTRNDVLAPNMSYPTITLLVNVAGSAPPSVTNTAAVSGGGESNTANDGASDPTTIDGASAGPDLSLSKSHAGNFTQGQNGVYSLIAHNIGGAATTATVTVTDTLPASLTAISMNGSGWTCTLASRSCTRADALAGGASYAPITLTVNVAADAPVNIVNTANVSGGAETNTGNDAVSDPTTIFQIGGIHAPVAVGDAIEVAPGDATDALVGDATPPSSVLDNDIDPDNDSLTAIKLTDPSHGLIAFASDGQFTYVNDGTGIADSFTYRACDASNNCSAATKVTITIGNGLDGHVPFAVGDAIQLIPGGTSDTLIGDATAPSSVLDNDIDPDGDTLTATRLTNPAEGDLVFNADGTFSYHHTGQGTTDSWLYEACDGGGACDLGTVTVTIDTNPSDRLPIVVDDAIQVLPGDTSASLIGDLNTTDSFLDNDSDPDLGDSLIVAKVGALMNGSGTLAFNTNGTFSYQNTNTSVPSDTAFYEACDDYGACTPGIISVSITTDPMDLAPMPADDTINVAPGGTADTLVGDPAVPGSVLHNDSDTDGDPLVAHLISAPANGSVVLNVDGTFVYVNTDQTASTDEWRYEACDPQGACVAARVSVTIDHSAPAVTCVLPRQVNVVGDTVSLDLSLLFTAPAGQSLIYGASNAPSSLSVVGSLLSGILQASDVPGSPYASTLSATTVPGNVSASESVTFQVLPVGEIMLRNGFDGSNSSQVCN